MRWVACQPTRGWQAVPTRPPDNNARPLSGPHRLYWTPRGRTASQSLTSPRRECKEQATLTNPLR